MFTEKRSAAPTTLPLPQRKLRPRAGTGERDVLLRLRPSGVLVQYLTGNQMASAVKGMV